MGLFSSASRQSPNSFKYELERVLLSHNFLKKITEVREEYKNSLSQGKYTHNLKVLKIVEEVRPEPERLAQTHEQKLIMDLGFQNLIDDLVNISPQVLSTHRIVVENIVVMASIFAKERGRIEPLEVSDTVVQLTPERVRQNTEYVEAKRQAISLIGAYRDLPQVSKEIRNERIDELLFADRRYMLLREPDRERLVSIISSKVEEGLIENLEGVINRYFEGLLQTEKRLL